MSCKCRCLVVIAVFLAAARLWSLDPGKALTQYGITAWAAGQDRSPAVINQILQGKNGYLWLATNNGLVRFDGIRFVTFSRSNSGLASNALESIWEDQEGTLWIGTTNGSVCSFKNQYARCFSKADGIPDGEVRTIVGDGAGGFWFGVVAAGLGHYQNGHFSILRTSDGLPNPNITHLMRSPDGALWISTYDGGVFVYRAGRYRQIGKPVLPSNLVWRTSEDKEGNIWVATFQGLCELKTESDRKPRTFGKHDGLPVENVTNVYSDREGQIWAASYGGGVSRLAGARFASLGTADGLSDASVSSLLEDVEGDLWIGTRGGLNRLRDQSFSTFGARQGLPEDFMRVVMELNDGAIFAGTLNRGFAILNHKDHANPIRKQVADCSPLTAYQDRSSDLWVGCAGGKIQHWTNGRLLQTFPLREGSRFVEVNALNALGSRLFAATFGLGLAELKNGVWVGHAVIPSVRNVSALLSGPDGLWVASMDKGLFRIDPDGSVTSFADKMQQSRPIRLSRDSDGAVWVVTDKGITNIRDGEVHNLTFVGTALQDAEIYSLLDDRRAEYWLSSSRGIFRVPRGFFDDRLHKETPQNRIELYGFADGVTAVDNVGFAEPTALLDSTGRVWFATDRGLLMAEPAKLKRNLLIPPVIVEQVRADDQLMVSGEDGIVHLPAIRHRIEFRFTCLSLVAPEDDAFRYRLEPLDTDWVDAHGERSAFYTDLPPGDYRFRVIASNNDGVWNSVGATLKITHEPHYYQRAWFRVLCILLGGILFGLGYRRNLQRMRREATKVQQAIAAEREQAMRLRADELTRINSDLRENLLRLSDGTTIEVTMTDLLRSAMEQTHAQSACIYVHDESTNLLKRRYKMAIDAPDSGERLEQYFSAETESVASNDLPFWQRIQHSRGTITIDTREPEGARMLWPLGLVWHREHNQPVALVTPLTLGSRVLGFLGLNFGFGFDSQRFTVDRQQLVDSFAALASMALETHRLSLVAREAAVAQERARLSEEMHDGIQQLFSAIAFQLESLSAQARKTEASKHLVPLVERVAEIAELGVQEVRRSIRALRDAVPITEEEFLGYLREVCRYHDGESIQCRLLPETELDLPTTPRLNDLRRVVQEAVGNACRHGCPSSVTIRLSREQESLAVVVEDDGTGFDLSQGSSGGMGLRNMRERARRLNGTISIDSSHRGTRITLRVPYTGLAM